MKRIYDAANLVLLFLIGSFIHSWYPRLPERIPTHFDFAGNPDGWSGREAFFALAAFPFVMTLVFYALIRFLPRIARDPRRLNIPHKEEFFKLPEEKRQVYWDLLREFFAGLMAALNLLFYILLRGTVRIAAGETNLLPFKDMLPAFAAMGLILIFYMLRLMRTPGKLVRGEI
ncbi:MAG: DUF1648 domain-containing protein [Candidatus Aminicenantes bacterium]